jgi:hypothetical protein
MHDCHFSRQHRAVERLDVGQRGRLSEGAVCGAGSPPLAVSDRRPLHAEGTRSKSDIAEVLATAA